MIIRKAERSDIAQLVELCKAHAAFENCSYSSKGKARLLETQLFQKNPPFRCLVVESNRALVGYTTYMKQFSTWDGMYYVYLDCLYLEQECRRKGIGRRLMSEIRLFAESENCTQIQWQTPVDNTQAIKFYKKMGAISKAKERFFWEV